MILWYIRSRRNRGALTGTTLRFTSRGSCCRAAMFQKPGRLGGRRHTSAKPRPAGQCASRNKVKSKILKCRSPVTARRHCAPTWLGLSPLIQVLFERISALSQRLSWLILTLRALTRPFSKRGPAAKSRAAARRLPPNPPRSHIYTGPRR